MENNDALSLEQEIEILKEENREIKILLTTIAEALKSHIDTQRFVLDSLKEVKSKLNMN